ncbi:alpha/beta fold hydrolase [Aquisphaera insulae]|uniref:alpha/beta fold hydrolase n=1 Tax=Aquisphaera insulae TaxID=2712864 RepID=UPI0013ECF433|nr:alpha/beta fold hydrolase [Aquisphaera insulae]
MVIAAAERISARSSALREFLDRHPGADFDRDGIRLHYLDEGAGAPVVMVHGNPTWSFHFRRLAEALSPTCRVVVPDHVGCGLSEKPDDARYDYTLESRVDDLEALLASLGIDRDIALVLHDWGGMIGMAYAARHPERISRLVVMNTAGFHMPAAKSFPPALWVCRDTPLGAWAVRGLNAFVRGTARIGCKRHPLSRDVREAYAAPYDSWAHRIAIHRFVQDIPLRPGDRCYDLVTGVQDRLPLLADVPMLVGWGLKDFVFDGTFLDEWTRRFPRATVLAYPDAGHYVLEDESEALIPAIREFLC